MFSSKRLTVQNLVFRTHYSYIKKKDHLLNYMVSWRQTPVTDYTNIYHFIFFIWNLFFLLCVVCILTMPSGTTWTVGYIYFFILSILFIILHIYTGFFFVNVAFLFYTDNVFFKYRISTFVCVLKWSFYTYIGVKLDGWFSLVYGV